MKNIDKINMLSCDHCEYLVSSSKIMDIHNRTFHGKVKKYNCDLCGHQVSHKCSLARHKKIVHEGVKFPCNATIKQHQKEVLLITKGQYMKESNFLAEIAASNLLLGQVSQYTKGNNILQEMVQLAKRLDKNKKKSTKYDI